LNYERARLSSGWTGQRREPDGRGTQEGRDREADGEIVCQIEMRRRGTTSARADTTARVDRRISMFQFTRTRSWVVLAGLGIVALTGAGARKGSTSTDPAAERYLFVCAGDQARTNPDFLAVVDFDPASVNYGKVITSPNRFR
jgi:hypothetical protein